MDLLKRYRSIVSALLVILGLYLITGWIVRTKRPVGAMSVIEAQAMDMSAMVTPLGSVPVATEKVARRPFVPTVTYTGSVVAYNDVEIYPRVTGWLLEVNVYPGDWVRKGQVIGRLDSAELSSRLKEAFFARQAAEREYHISREERRQAIAQKQAAEARVKGLRGALRDAQAQLTAAEAMREQTEREVEAAQDGLANAEANVTAAEAEVDYWSREIERMEKLYAAKAVSREEYDREKAQAKAAQAKFAQAQAAVREKQAMLEAAKSRLRQASANVTSAQARLDQVRADLQAAQAELAAANANVELNVHHTMHKAANLQQAEAQERTARIVRGYTELRATEEGVVTERLVSPGTLVEPGMAILRIQRIDKVRLQAHVAEADVEGIRVGNRVTVTTLKDASFRFQTRVTALFNAADPKSRTVIVEALTPNFDRRLLPGQYVVMEIAKGEPRLEITVPLSAIRRDADQKPFVWVVVPGAQEGKVIYICVMHPEIKSDKPGKCPNCGMNLEPEKKGGKWVVHRVEVTLGAEDGKRIVVKSGLKEGDEVIYQGHEYLKEGDPVAPVEWGVSGPKRLPEPTVPMEHQPGREHKPAGQEGHAEKAGDSRPTIARYSCPMHPEVVSDKPGECPKCGMKLVPE